MPSCEPLFPFVSPYANHRSEAKDPEEATRGHEGPGEDRLSSKKCVTGSEHKDAYVRFLALVAAIMRIVPRRDMERTKIDSFLTYA